MLRKRLVFVIGLVMAGLWGGVSTPALPVAAAEATTAAPGLTLSYPSAERVRLTWRASQWEIATAVTDGAPHSRVQMPGLAPAGIPGAPDLPAHGVLLGVPTADGLQLEVIAVRARAVALPAPLAVSADAALPTAHAAIGFSGAWRDQPVAQVQIFPVLPTADGRAARVAEELVIDLHWPATAQRPLRPEPAAFEQLLARTLANYDRLPRPTPLGGAPVASGVVAAAAPASAFPALKLRVGATGLYVLTHADLAGAGWNMATLDPARVQLRQRGQPVALRAVGMDDGRFDPGDLFQFYGQAYEDLYVKENVYWLHVEETPGLRMTTRHAAPTGAPAAADFPATLHLETDNYYWNTMTGAAPDEDYWFWGDRLSPNAYGLDITRTVSFPLQNIATLPYNATVRVQLKGRTAGAHRSRILLNGVAIDERSWSGFARFRHTVAINSALLQEGNNTLQVVAVNTGNLVDQWHFNWIELDYRDRFTAEGDALAFRLDGALPATVTVGNLSAAPLILDVTDPHAPVLITGATAETTAVTFHAAATGPWLVAAPPAWRAPLGVTADSPSNWSSAEHGADYIVITHPNFLAAAQELAAHRAGQGLRTAVVRVDDLYDEFNGGMLSPDAIRAFLLHAYTNWQPPAPLYVVLLGDGNQDYKDNLQSGAVNYVPPRMVATDDYGQVPSDNWYAAIVGGDALPDLLIGRLSAETPAQAQAIVAALIDYEAAPRPTTPAPGGALFVADDGETAFEWLSEYLIGRLPPTWTPTRSYARLYTTPTMAEDIINHILAGQTWVNYSGHGNYYRWGSYVANGVGHRILTEADTDALATAPIRPFYTILNCLNGFFSIPSNTIVPPYDEAMAEALQRNGAIAVWADSGFGYTSGQYLISGHLMDVMIRDDIWNLGAATTEAKLRTVAQSSYWVRMVETFILFGDPVTTLNAPPNPPVVKTTLPADAAVAVDPVAPIVVTFTKRMNPAAVALSGPAGWTFTPTWNATFDQVTFAHHMFRPGTTVTLTVTGQDNGGLPLAAGAVPTTWSFTTSSDVPTAVELSRSTAASGSWLLWTAAVALAAGTAVGLARRRRPAA